jgi:hypothetical protein
VSSCTSRSRLRRRLRRRLAVLLGAALLAPLALAQSLHDVELRRLDGTGRQALAQVADGPLLLMLFEPACGWCLRQSRAINTLLGECPQLAAVAVGVDGSRRDLRDSVRRYRADFPAFEASAELLGALGDIEGTPFTLIADAGGLPLGWLRGYVPAPRLRASLEQFDATLCAGKAPTAGS